MASGHVTCSYPQSASAQSYQHTNHCHRATAHLQLNILLLLLYSRERTERKEAGGSAETSVFILPTTRSHIPEDNYLHCTHIPRIVMSTVTQGLSLANDIRTTAILLSPMARNLKFGGVGWPSVSGLMSIQNFVKILRVVLNLRHNADRQTDSTDQPHVHVKFTNSFQRTGPDTKIPQNRTRLSK
jgi:hypothetical protein